jgi:hypothetical protein
MKKAIVLALALLLAGTYAVANDTNGRDGSGGYGPIGDGYANLRDVSDVLIYQCREANDGFGDLIPIYEAILVNGGATVSSIDAPSGGGAFPDPLTPSDYCVVFVLTTENWWSPNFPPGDEAVLLGYMQAGGNVYFSGQDYLYGAGYFDGSMVGLFPYELGLDSVIQDTPFGADFMDVLGQNLFDGIYMFLDASTIFLANPFYPDTFTPRADGGLGAWEQLSPEQHIGGITYDSGTYRVIYTSIELAGDTLLVFPDALLFSWEWLQYYCTPVATEETSLGKIKANW